MKRIILLRHAQCEGEGYIGAGSDVHLTRTGHARAVQLIAEIEDLAPEMIYSSPLLRCRETLMPYLEKNQQTLVSYDAALREMEFGSFESLTYEQISRRYPEAQTAWYANQITGRPPGGESLQELHSRVEGFLSRKILKCPAERILICAHGGSLRALICELLAIGPGHHWDFRLERGNLAELHLHDERIAALSCLNTVSLIDQKDRNA